MTYEKYLTKRNELLERAENAADNDSEFENITNEINDLDKAYDNYVKNQTNINALRNSGAISNLSGMVSNVESVVENSMEARPMENVTNSKDYRLAFMNFVCKGASIPSKFLNVDENTTTTDVGVLIPETVNNRIIEKMETIGRIYGLVTKSNVKGGIKIPVSNVKPVASWVEEGKGSDKQKKTITYITFSYNKLRCAISVTYEVSEMALPIFETTFVNQVSQAMIKAIETAIISGDGATMPTGIFTETVETGKEIATKTIDYKLLCQAEAAIDEEYEAGAIWLMSKKTFMEFLSMVDSNGQPIARVNYGINGKAERSLLGRSVECTNYIPSYSDTLEAGTRFACIVRMEDYLLNTNSQVTIKTYEDNETDDKVTKAITLVDGKMVDTNSLVFLNKKA